MVIICSTLLFLFKLKNTLLSFFKGTCSDIVTNTSNWVCKTPAAIYCVVCGTGSTCLQCNQTSNNKYLSSNNNSCLTDCTTDTS